MAAGKPRACSRGLTLVELLVAALVVITLLGVGLPAANHLLQRTRLASAASRMLLSLNAARSEAIKRGVPVRICPRDPHAAVEPVCGGRFRDGWITFADRNDNRQWDSGEALIRVDRGLPAGYLVTNRSGTRAAGDTITYYPDGSSRRNRTLLFCPPPGTSRLSRAVVLNLVGRPRFAGDWGSCPRTPAPF